MDKISVIIPIYKVEKYMRKCIESVISQTYTNLEIILVNDGSPDRCPEICDEYAKLDKRIVVIHKENGGLSDARNAGVAIAKGEYIGFVDGDDYIAPDMYEKLYKTIISQKADLAICSLSIVDEKGENISQLSPIQNEVMNGLDALRKLQDSMQWFYVTACNKLYKRDLFRNIVFPVGKINEDFFTVHEFFFSSTIIVSIEQPLYYYLQREGSITHQKKNIKQLDEIEGCYRRFCFYEKHGLLELLSGVARLATSRYLTLTQGVCPCDRKEKKRFRQINHMFTHIYIYGIQDKTIKDYLFGFFPMWYCRGARMKTKLRKCLKLRSFEK